MKKEIVAYKNEDITIIIQYENANINRVQLFVNIIRNLFNHNLMKGNDNVETI